MPTCLRPSNWLDDVGSVKCHKSTGAAAVLPESEDRLTNRVHKTQAYFSQNLAPHSSFQEMLLQDALHSRCGLLKFYCGLSFCYCGLSFFAGIFTVISLGVGSTNTVSANSPPYTIPARTPKTNKKRIKLGIQHDPSIHPPPLCKIDTELATG